MNLERGSEAKSLGLFQFRVGVDVMEQKLSLLPSQNLVVRQEQIFFVRLPHELFQLPHVSLSREVCSDPPLDLGDRQDSLRVVRTSV